MTKEPKKVVSVKQYWSLDDVGYKEWIRWLGEIMDTESMSKVVKTFKVWNYNKDITNWVLKNIEIEIEWLPVENDLNFSKEMNHYFK